MKYTIEGFSQAYAMTLRKQVEKNGKIVTRKIDCTDLVILRWFIDFYPNMKKIEVDGKQYAWLTHKKLLEDLPLIDISKSAFIDRMQKLAEFDILEYRFVKDSKGTFSLYSFGKNYENLIGGVQVQTHTGYMIEPIRGICSNTYGVQVQTDTKDTSIIDTSTNIIKDIVEYLNKKTGTAYRYNSQATQRHIKARLNEGYTLSDFKMVIDKKVDEWKGTEMEQYLRPETLFSTKFENYLNAKINRKTPARKKAIIGGIDIERREYTNEQYDLMFTSLDEDDT